MKAKPERRSSATASTPTTKSRHSRRGAVTPTRGVKALRSVSGSEREITVVPTREVRTHLTHPTTFLSHSLHLRAQNLGRAGR
jgi:hypothetical protein